MITKRQKEVLDFVEKFVRENSYSPSLEEIMKHLGLSSVSTAHFHVSSLQAGGYLEKISKRARSISVTNSSPDAEIPLVGLIAAGGPIEAISNPEPIEVPKNMVSRGGNYYALKVKGTSMIEEGISDGDIVVVNEQPTVNNGEKAVAYLPDKNTVTLKKIFQEKSRIKLMPANQYMEPFYETNVNVQGKVVGVLRNEA